MAADHVHAAVDPLHVHVALGAFCPWPPSSPAGHPCLFILPKPLELRADNAVMPTHLALRTEQPGAVWALRFRYHSLTTAVVTVNQQRRTVFERTVELERPQSRVAERSSPPLEHLKWDHITALLRVQRTILAPKVGAANGQHILLDFCNDVLAHTADAERVRAPGTGKELADVHGLHANGAVEVAGGTMRALAELLNHAIPRFFTFAAGIHVLKRGKGVMKNMSPLLCLGHARRSTRRHRAAGHPGGLCLGRVLQKQAMKMTWSQLSGCHEASDEGNT
jgi:hypothetical protein